MNIEEESDKALAAAKAPKAQMESARTKMNVERIADGIRCAIADSHGAAVKAGWYTDLATGQRKEMNKGERLMLIVSELSECMEGIRKSLMDDKLPHRSMEEVELADALIRIFDYAGDNNLDLAGAYIEKRAYNDSRADHKIENRVKDNGKKF